MFFLLLLAKLINGYGKFLFKKFHCAQHARVKKIHLGKNVESIVLQRRTT